MLSSHRNWINLKINEVFPTFANPHTLALQVGRWLSVWHLRVPRLGLWDDVVTKRGETGATEGMCRKPPPRVALFTLKKPDGSQDQSWMGTTSPSRYPLHIWWSQGVRLNFQDVLQFSPAHPALLFASNELCLGKQPLGKLVPSYIDKISWGHTALTIGFLRNCRRGYEIKSKH